MSQIQDSICLERKAGSPNALSSVASFSLLRVRISVRSLGAFMGAKLRLEVAACLCDGFSAAFFLVQVEFCHPASQRLLLAHSELDLLAVDQRQGICSVVALLYFVQVDQLAVVQTLIEAGADLEAKAAVGMYPLGIAAWLGKLPIVELLIEAGADVDAESEPSDTALSVAADHRHSEVVDRDPGG